MADMAGKAAARKRLVTMVILRLSPLRRQALTVWLETVAPAGRWEAAGAGGGGAGWAANHGKLWEVAPGGLEVIRWGRLVRRDRGVVLFNPVSDTSGSSPYEWGFGTLEGRLRQHF
jgi:hypothetical protein